MTERRSVQPVVFDVNVFIDAVVSGQDSFESWPSPPPTSGHYAADCVGIVNDAVEFSLWLSPHVLTNIERVLEATEAYAGFEWDPELIEEYLNVLVEIADASGGGVLEPDEAVTDCPDYEDNCILELALAAQAVLIVSNDSDLLHMTPWRGIPVLSPRDFAARVDASRRAKHH
ncbi:MAG: putative toxin-antitoxin system toxin component, PIN family [Candidatus Dormibacteria bacterium]